VLTKESAILWLVVARASGAKTTVLAKPVGELQLVALEFVLFVKFDCAIVSRAQTKRVHDMIDIRFILGKGKRLLGSREWKTKSNGERQRIHICLDRSLSNARA